MRVNFVNSLQIKGSARVPEPDPSLFTVPSDYKIVDDKDGPVTVRMVSPAPPAK